MVSSQNQIRSHSRPITQAMHHKLSRYTPGCTASSIIYYVINPPAQCYLHLMRYSACFGNLHLEGERAEAGTAWCNPSCRQPPPVHKPFIMLTPSLPHIPILCQLPPSMRYVSESNPNVLQATCSTGSIHFVSPCVQYYVLHLKNLVTGE